LRFAGFALSSVARQDALRSLGGGGLPQRHEHRVSSIHAPPRPEGPGRGIRPSLPAQRTGDPGHRGQCRESRGLGAQALARLLRPLLRTAPRQFRAAQKKPRTIRGPIGEFAQLRSRRSEPDAALPWPQQLR